MTPIRQLVLDFDGTCTVVEEVAAAFLRRYRELVAAEWSPVADAAWDESEAQVRTASPEAAWMLGGAPAAPAAADPYILSSETVALLGRRGVAGRAPDAAGGWYKRAYLDHPAPWRPEARELLETAVAGGRRVAFISNSAPDAIGARIDELALTPQVRARIRVLGNAAKFKVQEPRFEAPLAPSLAARFRALPASAPSDLSRPIYLRRGSYYEALCAVWEAEGTSPEETLIAGDVWELDLAMPAALGCAVHLVRRAAPYATYPYELAAATAAGAESSDDLGPVLARVRQAP